MELNQIQPPSQPKTPPVSSVPKTPEFPKGPEKLLMAPHHTSWGAALGIVIILILLVVGALYFWGAKLTRDDAAAALPASRLTPEADPSISDTGFEVDTKVTP